MLGTDLGTSLGPSLSSGGGGAEDTPETIFGAKVAEWFRADLGIDDGGGGAGVVDSWTGQKAGVVITAPAAGNRCVFNSSVAAFGNRPTVSAVKANSNYLIATSINPPLIEADANASLIAVMRTTWTAATENQLALSGVGSTVIHLFRCVNGTQVRGLTIEAGPTSRTVDLTVTQSTVAIWRLDHQVAADAAGTKAFHGATSGTAASGGNRLADLTEIIFGASNAGTQFGSPECAEFVILNDLPAAGELTAYAAYVLGRYGI